jgi:predicted Zn-dependent protease with MMP-like domain
MDRAKFHAVVVAAIDEIPEPFRSHLENVEWLSRTNRVRDPARDGARSTARHHLRALRRRAGGRARTRRSPLLPDRIVIYYRPLVHDFRTPGAIRREIRKTIIHEVGHVFGLDDDEIEAEGY